MIAVKIFKDLEFIFSIKTTPEQRQDYINEINEAIKSSDSIVKIDNSIFRIINEKNIREIYQKEKELELKLNLDIPSWVEIDWTKTVQNCLNAEGYESHFNGGKYASLWSNGYYIFRIN